MKLKITYITFLFIIGTFCISAQNDFKELSLSTAQKELLQKQKILVKNNREAFKKLLTEKQKRILADKTLSKKERQNALKASLTSTQKNLLVQNKESLSKAKIAFRNSLTKEQKQRIRKRAKSDKGQSRNNIREKIKKQRKRN